MPTPTQMESLRNAISYDRLPVCSGAVSSPPEALYLYYGKEKPRFVNFGSATPEDLDSLVAACDPATFGRGDEDVYDESYRKAFKMDAANFAVQFDLAASGLIGTLEDRLLQGDTGNMKIKAELYKLNVYDKDSFFKAHRDTPRGTNMIGSLMIIYPTPHEGGELVLRHKDHEWKFDAKSLTASQVSPSLAYVAFYSDIEHEVLKVTSGRRVTITYNLYLEVPAADTRASTIIREVKSISNLQRTLQGLLKSPEFLPTGATLGFGLVHLYPVTFNTKLRDLANYLKGEDANVYQVCRELRLQPSVRVIYDDVQRGSRFGIMMEKIVKNPSYHYEEEEGYEDRLIEIGGKAVNKKEGVDLSRIQERSSTNAELITWVSPFNRRTKLHDVNVTYGNEVSVGYMYCSPCIIVSIPPAIDRL
ncbi:hypothetical protein BJ322DRAFT_564598 [Thelephora terrestris]|uniref:Fe2OG dioxygenase domain-containing protein n=1 Tax=Thelephora terrestris TaxID=56493 RepID=A0A9P6LAI6_9AGAM|nr:hypothetical protein BJ322DRAFT_564598 [Thelephora terrestris]